MRKHAASSLGQTCGMPHCHGRWSLLFVPHSQRRRVGVGVILYFKCFPQCKSSGEILKRIRNVTFTNAQKATGWCKRRSQTHKNKTLLLKALLRWNKGTAQRAEPPQNTNWPQALAFSENPLISQIISPSVIVGTRDKTSSRDMTSSISPSVCMCAWVTLVFYLRGFRFLQSDYGTASFWRVIVCPLSSCFRGASINFSQQGGWVRWMGDESDGNRSVFSIQNLCVALCVYVWKKLLH